MERVKSQKEGFPQTLFCIIKCSSFFKRMSKGWWRRSLEKRSPLVEGGPNGFLGGGGGERNLCV